MSNSAKKNRQNRFEQEADIACNRSLIRVPQIHSHPIRKGNLAGFGNLPNAGQAWLGIQPSALPYLALGILIAR